MFKYTRVLVAKKEYSIEKESLKLHLPSCSRLQVRVSTSMGKTTIGCAGQHTILLGQEIDMLSDTL